MPDNIQEIVPQVYRISSVFGGRPLHQYLLRGETHTLLVDTGAATTAEEVILPALDELGISREQVHFAVITHCDVDHQGGAHTVKQALPNLILGCGEPDRRQVEDPDVLMEERYNAYRDEHGVGPDEAAQQFMREMVGQPQPMDLSWTNGERIRLSDDWTVQLLQMPGHSAGHLIVYDPQQRAAYTTDAVHYNCYRTVDGEVAMPPTYLDVSSYLQTIRAIGLLDLEVMAGGHWPVVRGEEVREFLAVSRDYVEMTGRAVRAELRESALAGMTLRELIDALNQQLGDWPVEAGSDLMFSLAGHLRLLEQIGLIEADRSIRPVRFQWVGSVAGA